VARIGCGCQAGSDLRGLRGTRRIGTPTYPAQCGRGEVEQERGSFKTGGLDHRGPGRGEFGIYDVKLASDSLASTQAGLDPCERVALGALRVTESVTCGFCGRAVRG